MLFKMKSRETWYTKEKSLDDIFSMQFLPSCFYLAITMPTNIFYDSNKITNFTLKKTENFTLRQAAL